MTGSGELLIVFAVIFLLFGASRLPNLARSIGQAQREFRRGLRDGADVSDPEAPSATAAGTADRPET